MCPFSDAFNYPQVLVFRCHWGTRYFMRTIGLDVTVRYKNSARALRGNQLFGMRGSDCWQMSTWRTNNRVVNRAFGWGRRLKYRKNASRDVSVACRLSEDRLNA